MQPLSTIEIHGARKLSSGDEHLLMVTTDRISAFDVILPDPIPDKGKVLNQISLFWFEKTRPIIPNHVVVTRTENYPPPFTDDERLEGRSVLVKKAKPLTVECVVRGYIAGSGWKEYQQRGSICGIQLPPGRKESEKLPEPIFTPPTTAEIGQHDEAIDFDTVIAMLGKDVAERVRDLSLQIYTMASEYALKQGIIIADTKFEFGLTCDSIILIDEVLTPDSSRFWPLDRYTTGASQPSFDKQFVRDYLETLDWNKTAPGPHLPEPIIAKTREKYIEAYERLTGKKL